MKYYVISYDEDGLSVEELEKQELLERIAEHYWGEGRGEGIDFVEDSIEFKEISTDKFLIIKGSIVVPYPEKIVESYEIE